MKNRLHLLPGLVAIALCLSSAPTVSAIIITPAGTSFGSLPAATFGGSGIPNDDVQIANIGNLTLGLTATPRYANPAVTNNGNGTFYANAGDDTANGQPAYAQWNFDFYVNGLADGQSVKLFYDNNGSGGNDVTSFFALPNYQDSWNLGMGFLSGGIFDPNANGEYGFALVAYANTEAGAVELGRSAILVNVSDGSTVPDGGSTILLLGSVLAGLAVLRRRFIS